MLLRHAVRKAPERAFTSAPTLPTVSADGLLLSKPGEPPVKFRHFFLATLVLIAGLYGWFSWGQTLFRPAAGDSEAELIEWIENGGFIWGLNDTGSTTVNSYIDMGNNVGTEIIKREERRRNGTLLTRTASQRTGGFCGGTYSMVFWRVDQDLNIAEIYYDTVWCFF
jgi:hypothetical protein